MTFWDRLLRSRFPGDYLVEVIRDRLESHARMCTVCDRAEGAGDACRVGQRRYAAWKRCVAAISHTEGD